MKNLMLFLVLISGVSHAQDYWIYRDSINGPPRTAMMAFELNGEGYVVGGADFFEFKRTMYSYDLEQDDWDNEEKIGGDAGMGLGRASGVAMSANGKAYVGLGGGSVEFFKDFWQYDPETESWSQMADFSGTARREAIGFSIDSTIFVGTGIDQFGLRHDFWKYEPYLNTWTQLSDFGGEKRRDAVGYRMGGKGYVGTGVGSTGYLVDFWEYDPIADSWTQKADFPGTPRHGAVGFGVFPNAYIALGEDNAFEYKDDVWEYNYFGDVWAQKTDFEGAGRSQSIAFVVDNRIFVGGGYNGQYYDDFYEYSYVLSSDAYNTELFAPYPNPTTDYLVIDLPENNPEFVNVFDVNGRNIPVVMDAYVGNGARLDFRNLSPGYYFVEIQNGNEKEVYKICFYSNS